MSTVAAERFAERRRAMLRDIAARGVRDEAVLRAMGEVPREDFVPGEMAAHAYADGPLPIGSGQTISQPYVVAFMIEAARPRAADRALDVGAGSGYSAAVLSRVVSEVWAIERLAGLARDAGERLERLGYENVRVRRGDGSRGWPEEAPFDIIVVAAAGPRIPESLRSQLAVGGRLVIPVGATRLEQDVMRVTRVDEGRFEEERLHPVCFVPLIGGEGWEAS